MIEEFNKVVENTDTPVVLNAEVIVSKNEVNIKGAPFEIIELIGKSLLGLFNKDEIISSIESTRSLTPATYNLKISIEDESINFDFKPQLDRKSMLDFIIMTIALGGQDDR